MISDDTHYERKTFTVEEVARVVGWSKAKTYRAAADGTLPVIRHGRRLVIPREALDRWLREAGSISSRPEGLPSGETARAGAP
jgi:excisionase family DNA binding protein